MVQTTLAYLDEYAILHPRFAKAFTALKEKAKEPFEAGRIPVDGDEIFINALSYDTKAPEEAVFEAHKTYIDVMLCLTGEESIGCLPGRAAQEITKEYDPEGDCYLAKLEAQRSSFSMKPGDVCIFFPNEMHAPGLYADQDSTHVTKFVMKVLMK